MGKSGEAEKNGKRKAPDAVATEAKDAPPLPASKLNRNSQQYRLSGESDAGSDSASGSPEEEEDSDQSSELQQDDIIHDSSDDDDDDDDDLGSPGLSSAEDDDSEDDRPSKLPRESTLKKQINGRGVQDTGTQESVVEDEITERMESTAPPGMNLQPCIQKNVLQPAVERFQIPFPSIFSASKTSDTGRGEATPVKGHPPIPARIHANTSAQPATSSPLVPPKVPEKHFLILKLPSIVSASKSSDADCGEATPVKGHPPIPARLHANTSSQPATSSLLVAPAPLVFDRLKPFLCEDTPKVSRVTANVVPPERRPVSSFPRFSHAKLMAMFWEVKDMLLSVKELENKELVRELDERITKLLFSVPGDVLTLKQCTILEELFKELYSLFDDIAGVNFLESTLHRCQEEEVSATKGKIELTTCVRGLSDKYDHLDTEINELEARIQNLKKEREQVVQEAETLEPKLQEADWTLRSASARVKEASEERDRAREAKVLALSRLEEFGRRL